jgi:hypothetical protein
MNQQSGEACSLYYLLMLRSYPWERRHPAGLPPEMAALPMRNISYLYKTW